MIAMVLYDTGRARARLCNGYLSVLDDIVLSCDIPNLRRTPSREICEFFFFFFFSICLVVKIGLTETSLTYDLLGS